ncbi:MAG: carboxypeptidase-like regulatory domain-containing protein [Bacteroidales bacterium]|nr:carboxypeptidase-like regulatory domain-containing protein [Bacteroidales bacterium]
MTLAILLILASLGLAEGQEEVLSSIHSFRNGTVKKGVALDILSRKTGYYFTYDSRLIDSESRTLFNVSEKTLEEILREIVNSDSVRLTIIGKHIIIARILPQMEIAAVEASPEEIFRIAGRIVDNDDGNPLPFATVAIRNKPRGTVSNVDGYFALNIPGEMLNDTLSISYLGFQNRSIPVIETLGNDFTIKMFRNYIPIPEIIIRSQIPQEIIRKCINAIMLNYGTTPASLLGFYREGIRKVRELQVYSEAVIRIHKAAYSSLNSDQVKVERSRKTENASPSDTLMLRLKAGLSSSLLLDGIKNLYEFMDEDFFHLYDYYMTDIVTIDEEAAYVIEFAQKESVRESLFRGSLMINTTDYGLMQADFELNPSYISEWNKAFITSQARGFTVRPASVDYRVTYKKVEGRYFLTHVRGDLRFNARKRRSIFSSSYDVFFEMVITEADTKNVTRFDRNEIIPLESVFSKTIKGYDADFWGDFDFLSPEEDLLRLLNSITQKLSGYMGGASR